MEESAKILAIIIGGVTVGGIAVYHFFSISGIGTIIGVIAGAVIAYFAQSKAQKRLWKRDFIIENIKTIYGPLYNAGLKIESTLNQIENSSQYTPLPLEEWNDVEGTFTYHMIDDDELRQELENFYVLIRAFNDISGKAWSLSHEIIHKRGSEFYGVNVRNIEYSVRTDDGGSSQAVIFNCVLFKKHPKDANYYKSGKTVISVEHQVGNTSQKLVFESIDKINEFDELWKQMIDDVNNDSELQYLESLKLQIRTKNVEILQKLIKRINERHSL